MSDRRSGRTLATQVELLPVHLTHRLVQVRRRFLSLFAGARAKALTVATLGAAIALAFLRGHPVVMAVAGAGLTLLAGSWVLAILERPVGLVLLGQRRFSLEGLTPVRETLRTLGLDPVTIERIAKAVDVGEEVRLAEFDQENRIVSEVGPIPYFGNDVITREQFIVRIRHRLAIVAVDGVVAVRKAYQSWISIENEALALAALSHLDGVPRIVRLDWRRRVMYQSFLAGENLGSLMAAKGATVSLQHRVVTERPRGGAWKDGAIASPSRTAAFAAMSAVTRDGCVEELGRMLEDVHRAGVTLGDIKYGNVLLQDGRPVLCDFDWSRVFARGSLTLLDRREDERDQLNYIFGSSLATLGGTDRAMVALFRERPELAEAAVDLGAGLRFGRRWTLEGGTGLWRAVRRSLPSIRGARILDLGTRDPIVLIELLRAGAAHVTTRQADPGVARFARLLHHAAELVDNRAYSFVIVDGPPLATGSVGQEHDTATAFGLNEPAQSDRVTGHLASLGASVTRFVFLRPDLDDVSGSSLGAALRAQGFAIESQVTSWHRSHSLVVATRAGTRGPS